MIKITSGRCGIYIVFFSFFFIITLAPKNIKTQHKTQHAENQTPAKRNTLYTHSHEKQNVPLQVTMKLISFLFTFAAALGFASAAGAGKKATLSEALRGSMEDRAEQTMGPPAVEGGGVSSSYLCFGNTQHLTPLFFYFTKSFLIYEQPADDINQVPAPRREIRRDWKGLAPALPHLRNVLGFARNIPKNIASFLDCRFARVPKTKEEVAQMNQDCFGWGPCPDHNDPGEINRLAVSVLI